jgi:hypothetical protein
MPRNRTNAAAIETAKSGEKLVTLGDEEDCFMPISEIEWESERIPKNNKGNEE